MCYAHQTSRGDTFFLHRRVQVNPARPGSATTFYFFAKAEKPETDTIFHQPTLPEGRVVSESHGMPILKRAPAATVAAA